MTKTERRNYSQLVAAVILPIQQARSFLKQNVHHPTTSVMPLLLHLTRTKRSNHRAAKDSTLRPLLQLANIALQPIKHLDTTLMETSKLPFRQTSPVRRSPSTFRGTSGKGGSTCLLCQPRSHSLDTSCKSRFATYQMALVNSKLSRVRR